jgi:hypothetical protein
MAEKQVYLGSVGPFLYDDADETDEHVARRGDIGSIISPISQTDVTSSRAFASTYQNTTGVSIMVKAFGYSDAGCVWTGYVGASSPPTTEVHKDTRVANAVCTIDLIVLPSYYYKINGSTGSLTLSGWFEYSLF